MRTMWKARAVWGIAVVGLVLLVTGASLAHGDAEADEHALTGEVVDLVCFMQHREDGQGAEHAACAKQCIQKGLPAGLLVGDEVYLLMGEGHDSIVDTVAALAAKRVRVEGRVIEQAGLKALVVSAIEEE